MNERLKHEGRLAVKENKAKQLEIQIKGLVGGMRDDLDEFEKVENLELDQVAELAVMARTKQIEYKSALAEIAAIKKALGK